MNKLNLVPHIAWAVFLVVLLLVFYMILAIIGHHEPLFIRDALIASVVAVIALARTDVPPGSSD